MNMLQERLEAAKIQAMKAKLTASDKDAAALRLQALRSALTSVAKAETSTKERRTLTDDEIVAVLRKEVGQRQESARIYREALQGARADQELAEAAVLESFLPQLLAEDATRTLVTGLMAELGVTDQKGMGKLMGALKGRNDVDKGLVSKIFREAIA